MTPHAKAMAAHSGSRADKGFKSTLFESPRLLLGMNCLEPGQTQVVHDHPGQDKFYCVVAGTGRFTVATDVFDAGPEVVVWAAAGEPHGVTNIGTTRLTMLVGIAPAPPAR